MCTYSVCLSSNTDSHFLDVTLDSVTSNVRTVKLGLVQLMDDFIFVVVKNLVSLF